MRAMANRMVHFTVPLLFGALGSVAAMAAVFITGAARLASGRLAASFLLNAILHACRSLSYDVNPTGISMKVARITLGGRSACLMLPAS